jgi:hypothetical protein
MTLIKSKSDLKFLNFWSLIQISFLEFVTQIAKLITFTLPKELKLIYFQMKKTRISKERGKV